MDETLSDVSIIVLDDITGDTTLVHRKKRKDKNKTNPETKRRSEKRKNRKKKRKADKCGETTAHDEGVSDLKVTHKKSFSGQSQDLEGSQTSTDALDTTPDPASGKKKKRRGGITELDEGVAELGVCQETRCPSLQEKSSKNDGKHASDNISPTGKKKKRKADQAGETTTSDEGVSDLQVSLKTSFTGQSQQLKGSKISTNASDEIPEAPPRKKKKRKGSITELDEGVADLGVCQETRWPSQQEKRSKNDGKYASDNISPTGKKKKRKADQAGETTTSNEGVSDLQVSLKTSFTGQSQERKGSKIRANASDAIPEAPPRKKKKRKADKEKEIAKLDEGVSGLQVTFTVQEKEVADEDYQGNQLPSSRTFKSKTQPIVDQKLFKKLCEYLPESTLALRNHVDVQRMIMYDLPRFKRFREQGIALRSGKFTVEENLRLRQNVKDFMSLTGVMDPIQLFHSKRFPQECMTLKKLKIKHRFFTRIAENIPRACHRIYIRGTKVFDDRNGKGNFTEEEDRLLLKYYKMYGSQWTKISELTERSAYSLEKRYAHQTYDKNRGPWSEREDRKLLRAVKKYVVSVLRTESPGTTLPKRVSRKILYEKLPWMKISRQVKTRTWTKCREKWMSMLTVRMSSGIYFKGKPALEMKIKLIKAMYKMEVEDAADINWEDLTTILGDVPPAYVQNKWHQLKVCHVPNWKDKCFGDIVDFLYEKVLPIMLENIEDIGDDELAVQQKESFLLKDIFREEECCSSDEESE